MGLADRRTSVSNIVTCDLDILALRTPIARNNELHFGLRARGICHAVPCIFEKDLDMRLYRHSRHILFLGSYFPAGLPATKCAY